jgi:hypothetical protein
MLIDPESIPSQQEHSNSPPNHIFSGHASTSLGQASGPASSSSPSTPLTISVAQLNETAMQRAAHVDYVASQEGPHHQPTWTIRCLSKCLCRVPGRDVFNNYFHSQQC